jgi:hypothetical protein
MVLHLQKQLHQFEDCSTAVIQLVLLKGPFGGGI